MTTLDRLTMLDTIADLRRIAVRTRPLAPAVSVRASALAAELELRVQRLGGGQ